jgi:hypothetical protein
MGDELDTDVEAAVRFLKWLRPDGPWPITVADADWKTGTPTTWLTSADEVRAFTARHSGHKGLFYTVATQRAGVVEKPKKGDLVETAHLHCDLDPPKEIAPADIDAWVDTKLDEVRTQSHSPPPSAIYRSGNGLHLIWALDCPFPLFGGDPARVTDIEGYNRALQIDFDADVGTWNCDRLLRLPGSQNLPNTKKRRNGRVPKATGIVELSDRVYSLADFRTAPLCQAKSNKGGAPTPAKRRDVRRLADIAELDTWGIGEADRLRVLIVQGHDPDKFDGDRSKVVFGLCCNMRRRGVPAELIVGIISDEAWPISEHVIERGKGDVVGYAWRQVERAIERVAAEGEPFETDKNGTPYPNQHNIRLALSKMGVCVRYDRFADRVVLTGLEGFGPYMNDAAMTRMRLRTDEEHKLKIGKELFSDVVEDAARRDDFHPVVDYLDALAWDGLPRLDGWMSTYLQAEDSEYTRHVGTIMLVAAVRRVRRPGCKFDEMVVLESEQGKAKSSALALIAVREEWFSDDLPLSANTQQVIERTQGRWIIEAGELSGMGKRGVDHLKAFLSRRADRSRMAYGRLPHDAPRHFIVVGTTNDDKYLIDSTGNRRFWPVRVGDIDLDALARDRDQLWAEAAVREAAGESIRLDRALWQAAALEQEERRTVDPFVAPLADLFRDLLGKVASREVWQFIGTPIGLRTPELERRLGAAMRELGFEHGKRRFGGGPEGCYLRGDDEARTRRIVVTYFSGENGERGDWEAFLEGGDLPARQAALRLGGNDGPY